MAKGLPVELPVTTQQIMAELPAGQTAQELDAGAGAGARVEETGRGRV